MSSLFRQQGAGEAVWLNCYVLKIAIQKLPIQLPDSRHQTIRTTLEAFEAQKCITSRWLDTNSQPTYMSAISNFLSWKPGTILQWYVHLENIEFYLLGTYLPTYLLREVGKLACSQVSYLLTYLPTYLPKYSNEPFPSTTHLLLVSTADIPLDAFGAYILT